MDVLSFKRPTFLNNNDAFDILKPFRVTDRLETLAFLMSIEPPQLDEPAKPPSVSSSKFTTFIVEKDHGCTVLPLQGPPPEFIQELLPLEIDFTPSSPLSLAITKSNPSCLFHLCGQITKPTMPCGPISDRDKND